MLLGDSGTGKSHLLIGLGIAACQRGLQVRYTTAAALVNEPADERQLSRLVARYGRLDLLCLDELNFVHLDPRGAELLFQILTERIERASVAVAVASNAPFSGWGQTFEAPRLTAAVVDRLTFRAHIIETGSGSPNPPTGVLHRPEPNRRVRPVTMTNRGPSQIIVPAPEAHVSSSLTLSQICAADCHAFPSLS